MTVGNQVFLLALVLAAFGGGLAPPMDEFECRKEARPIINAQPRRLLVAVLALPRIHKMQ